MACSSRLLIYSEIQHRVIVSIGNHRATWCISVSEMGSLVLIRPVVWRWPFHSLSTAPLVQDSRSTSLRLHGLCAASERCLVLRRFATELAVSPLSQGTIDRTGRYDLTAERTVGAALNPPRAQARSHPGRDRQVLSQLPPVWTDRRIPHRRQGQRNERDRQRGTQGKTGWFGMHG
jgi:hypothetical protein